MSTGDLAVHVDEFPNNEQQNSVIVQKKDKWLSSKTWMTLVEKTNILQWWQQQIHSWSVTLRMLTQDRYS